MNKSRLERISEYAERLPFDTSIEKLLYIDELSTSQFWREHQLGEDVNVEDFLSFMEILTLQYQYHLPNLATILAASPIEVKGQSVGLLSYMSLYHSLFYNKTELLGDLALAYVEHYCVEIRPAFIKIVKSQINLRANNNES